MNPRTCAHVVVLCVLALVGCGCCGSTAPSESALLTVITSPPVVGARVVGSTDTHHAFDVLTGTDGRVTIALPASSQQASLTISAPGWVTIGVCAALSVSTPAVLTFTMTRAK